jgi:hypothetical protein
MKQRLFYFISLLVIVASLIVSVFPSSGKIYADYPSANYAADATKYCTGAGYNGTDCTNAYENGYLHYTNSTWHCDTGDGACSNGLTHGIAQAKIDAGASSGTTTTQDPGTTYCKSQLTKPSSTELASCAKVYDAGYKSQTPTTTMCNSPPAGLTKTLCGQTFNAGYVANPTANSGSGTSSDQGVTWCQNSSNNIAAKDVKACAVIYDNGFGANVDNSSSYCKNPTGGISTKECTTIYKAGNTQAQKNVNTNTNTPAGGSSNPTAPTCEDGKSPLSWIFCALINDLSSGVDWMYGNVIQPLLLINPVNLTDNNPTDHTYQIWSNFRIYGDIFLVIALLVIVYSESIGGGMLDAYAVRKILPRLLAAAILINLSIYLVAIAVDISNIVGHGINNLLEAPFQSNINSGHYYVLNMSSSASTGTQAAAATGSAVTLVAIVAGLWNISLAGSILMYLVVAFLVPALFIFMAIMVTVILRRGLIILLIFLSPIAFALYCLPNTEQYFRRWWDMLFRTLLVYPIIAVMFALGDIMSVTITSSSTGFVSSYLATFIGAISLFVPIALIPFSFRIAGGVLGRFHDFATQKATQAHQGFRGDKENPESLQGRLKYKKDVETAKAGFNNRAISARINPRTAFKRQQRLDNVASIRDSHLKALGQKYMEADSVAKNNAGNDNYDLAVAAPEMAERKMNEATNSTEKAAWRTAIAAANVTGKDSATRMASAQRLFASGYQIADGEEGYEQMSKIVGSILGEGGSGLQISRGFDENGNMAVQAQGTNAGAYANAMNQAQYGERTAGRFDLAGINNGAGYSYDSGIAKANSYTAGSQAKPQTFMAGASANFGRDVGAGLKDKKALEANYEGHMNSLATQLAQNINSGTASPERLGAWHSMLLGAGQNATGANMNEISKQRDLLERTVAQLNTGGASTNANANTFINNYQRNESQYNRGGGANPPEAEKQPHP